MDTIALTKDEERIILSALWDKRKALIRKANKECRGQLVEYDENDPLDREMDGLRAVTIKLNEIYRRESDV